MKIKRHLKYESNILLTPLIDMIFLVVIFFMLNASMALAPAIDVNLPSAFTGRSVIEKEIIVTISANGTIYIGGKNVKINDFPARLKEEMSSLNKREIFLQVDRNVKYDSVVEVIDLARLAGIKKISLITVKKSLVK